MTQDFAKKAHSPQAKKTTRKTRSNTRRKPSAKANSPTWTYWVIGLLLSILLGLLIYIINHQNESTIKTNHSKASDNPQQEPQPRFDFYQILKQQTVEVPDRSDEITSKLPENSRFFLQASSFRNPADADELRAQLLLLNLEVKVEPGSKEGEAWHRVIVGPFDSRSKAAKARSILASNNLTPLLLRRKNE